ncbi:MAG: hypothetical protein AB1486_19560 [Planctomycetota bacterium]
MRRILIVLIAGLLGCAIMREARAGEGRDLTPEERAFIENTLSYFSLAHEHSGNLWPAYDLSTIPIIFHDHEASSGFLFNGPEKLPPGFALLDEFPSVAFRAEGVVYNQGFELGIPIGGVVGAAIGISESYGLVAHEVFHHYQSSKSFHKGGASDNNLPQPANLALAQLEQRCLAQALRCDERKRLLEPVRDFLRARSRRHSGLDSRIVELEHTLEAREGTAEYVQRLTSAAILGKLPHPVAEAKESGDVLEGLAAKLEQRLSVESYRTLRYYQTGFAIGLLLDRFEMAEWKKRVETGATLTDLLRDASGFGDEDLAPQNDLTQSAEFQVLLRDAETTIASERNRLQERADAFHRSRGVKTVLRLEGRLKKEAFMSKAEDLAWVEPGKALFGKGSKISLNREQAFVEVYDELLMEWKGGAVCCTFYVTDPRIEVDGQDVDVETERGAGQEVDRRGKLVLNSSKCAIRAADGRVSTDKEGLQLVLY